MIAERPVVLVVMGVSSSGKTTVGELLAQRLGWPFQEGDDMHPKANVEKMASGIALTDTDRWPWLHAIAARIDAWRAEGVSGVVACSALKRVYRDLLIGPRSGVRLIYEHGDEALIRARMAARKGHFMPQALLDSQFAALEEPAPEERAIIIDVALSPEQQVETIMERLAQVGPHG